MCLFNIFMVLLLFRFSGAQIFPIERYLTSLNASRALSAECSVQIDAYVNGLFNNQSWAWNLFDASPKLPYGILTGNLLEAGNYDQCLSVQHNGVDGRILGKFCRGAYAVIFPVNLAVDTLTESVSTKDLDLRYSTLDTSFSIRSSLPIRPENGYRVLGLSVCVPDACTPAEMLEYLYISDLGLPILPLDNTACETSDEESNLTGADIAFLTFISLILFLVIVCTVYDELLRNKEAPVNPLFVSFSILRNFKKLTEDSDNTNRIACLDGLRVFSILWVILGHRFSISAVLPFVNNDYVDQWKMETYTQYAQGASLAVDTFMFLTGLLMAMSFIKTQSKPNSKFNVFIYYIHRYIRLTPALAVLYFMHVSVFVYLGSGPYWSYFTERTKTNCLNRWASFFFYYQNYLDHNNMCLMHTWYLSMDMQIFIASPLVLLPLAKYRKPMMKFGMPILIILSIICPFVITYVYETQIFTDDYFWYYYYPTHTRFASWLVGVYTGGIIYAYKGAKLEINTLLNMFIWAVVVVGMVACVFSGNYIAYHYERLATSFYISLHRPSWCFGLAWVVFSCMKGRGGLFNFVLSANIFQTLAKITYSMYLVHASLLLLNVAKTRFPGHFGDLETIHLFLGDMLTAMTIGFIWAVLFESPIVAIEKVVFGGGGKRKPREKKTSVVEEVKIDNQSPEVKGDDEFEKQPETQTSNGPKLETHKDAHATKVDHFEKL